MKDESHIQKLRLEVDYIERQIYLNKATYEDKQRLKKISKYLYKLTK
jgi:hypothetical protein